MAIAPFLAMTAAEFRDASSLPPRIAWMACHFSPYGLGLSNLPYELPPNSLLMVDDITPPHGHDPERIVQQLKERVEALRCCGVFLDFQRRNCEETKVITKYIAQALPCPVSVSQWYAEEVVDCAVFLPPPPPSESLEAHILPWIERKIWLELSTDGEIIILTDQGAEICPFSYPDTQIDGFQEKNLCCHYSVQTKEKSARFTLWRTKDDIDALLKEAESLGIAGVIGLYQEFGTS